MKEPKIAGRAPLPIELKAGQKVAWCACGLSSKQPLCDGSHKGTSFAPVMTTVDEDKKVWLCTCKRTSNPGFCDGTHKSL